MFPPQLLDKLKPMSRFEISPGEFREPGFQASEWCRRLEEGHILYFPETPFEFPQADIDFLLNQRQSRAKYRKNIAYRPLQDRVTGMAGNSRDVQRMLKVLSKYSRSVTKFLEVGLAPYAVNWRLDYASFRPIQEKGREISQKRRNDLLHVDAFPTRATRGNRILRFFTNINPEEPRHWVVGKPFSESVSGWLAAGMALPQPRESPGSALKRNLARAARRVGLPVPAPSRYDDFMLGLHDFLKASWSYQRDCEKETCFFSPGSSWMVYTDSVPHAALSGRFALEQTFMIDRRAMLFPEKAPVSILEKIVGCSLTD